jgi:Predicted N-acetylglucosamine kinase
MNGYVLGVDGGGTKTHYALYHPQTNHLDVLTAGPSNHEGMPGSFAQLKNELGENIYALLSKNHLAPDDIAMSMLGLSGVDTARQHQIISGILQELSLARFVLTNDAYLGIKAGAKSGSGICAINGSGCSVAAIDQAGGRVQVGGLGDYTCDFGGSHSFVPFSVGAVYSELFRCGEPTLLTPMMMDLLAVKDKYAIVEEIALRLVTNRKPFILAISKLLFEACDKGDSVALGLLRQSGDSYAHSIAGAMRELAFQKDKPVEIILAGSLFTKQPNPAMPDALKSTLQTLQPEYEFDLKRLHTPNVAGALLWALDELNIQGHRAHVEEGLQRCLP